MTPDELRTRIARGEDMHTDFKRELGSTRELAKDIVCLANTDGGVLLVGVDDNGSPVGVADPDQAMLKADDVAYQLCRPPVRIVPETVELDGVTVVVLNIPKGDERPYATPDGRYYTRSGPRCRAASRDELLRMFQATDSLFADERPVPRTTLADLDLDEAERLANETLGDVEVDQLPRILDAWGMVSGTTPTLGGLVVFGRQPQDHLVSSTVVFAAFAGIDTGDDLLHRVDVTGGIFDVIDQLEQLLDTYLPSAHAIRGFDPERHEAVPKAALREAVVNALCHRDYTIAAPVRVFVLADRVEVHAPGRPPNSVTEAAMRAGVHVPRNPRIYARVADGALATRAGTGVRRISRILQEEGGVELGIEINDVETVLVLPRADALR